MAAGDITATTTQCDTIAEIKTYLDTVSTGAATASDDTTTYQVVQCNNGSFIVVKIVRAGA